MDERGVPHSGTQQKFMPLRVQCRFVTLDGVDFTSHRGAARAALLDAFGKRPVTMRVLSRLQPGGSRAWYVQASLEVTSGFEASRCVTRESGVLGLDFNARGVAWCAVKPDGNRLRDQHGFMSWQLKGLTEAERKQVIGTTVAQLARHAKRLSLAAAIESLDFSTKRLMARAGAVNKRYNDMLGSLPSSQFEQMMLRTCEKQHLTLYSVNPVYSSVGGFAKYGCANPMNADTSAALWIGRQALLADVRKDEGPRAYMKHFDERLVFPHLPATPMQRMAALAGAHWRNVAWGLVSNRRHLVHEAPALGRTPSRDRFPPWLESARAACRGVVARRIEEMVLSPRSLASRAERVVGDDFFSGHEKTAPVVLVRSLNGLATLCENG